MKFFRTITNSLVSKGFYTDLLQNPHGKPIKKGLWYLFRLYVIVALFLTILISINISAVLPRLDAAARNLLPSGAEIVLRDGSLTTNTNPIIVPVPKSAEPLHARTGEGANDASTSTSASLEDVSNLIVLDITASSSIEALRERDTLALITSEGFIFQGDGGRYTVGRFSNVEDLDVTVDEAWLVQKAEWLKGFARFIPFVAFFLVLIGLYATSLLACVFYALIILLIMRIQKKDHQFGTAYVIAMYSRTFAIALGLLAYVIPVFGIDTVSIAAQLVFITLMLRSRKSIINTEDDAHEIKA